jgi:acetyl esterase/lipase
MTDRDLDALSRAPAGTRIAYGTEPLQFGELSLPSGGGPHPVIVNIHGGIWLAQYDIGHSRAQAQALAAAGFAVWNVEYRRVGDVGGGWPGTFRDVAIAADHVRILAQSMPLDLSRVVAMGHSAGGQLALWLASRRQLPGDSELFVRDPLLLNGVVALAPATELATLQERGSYEGVVDRLIGGSPREVPDRYDWTMPGRRVPLGVPQRIVVGRHDETWGWHAQAYERAVRAVGEDSVHFVWVENAGHFELIAPGSSAWPAVVTAARELSVDT